MLSGILLANGTLPATILTSLFTDNIVKEGIAASFAVKLFKAWMAEKDANSVTSALRKANLDKRLLVSYVQPGLETLSGMEISSLYPVEEAILKWYKEAHVAKGKSVFLDQMKKFVEWLQNAEEGTEVIGEGN
uniref:eIF5-mimic protein 1 n=1 Tax=Amazona collaria TaxID=241587 RepID=A0A8B9IVC5_9PSIT